MQDSSSGTIAIAPSSNTITDSNNIKSDNISSNNNNIINVSGNVSTISSNMHTSSISQNSNNSSNSRYIDRAKHSAAECKRRLELRDKFFELQRVCNCVYRDRMNVLQTAIQTIKYQDNIIQQLTLKLNKLQNNGNNSSEDNTTTTTNNNTSNTNTSSNVNNSNSKGISAGSTGGVVIKSENVNNNTTTSIIGGNSSSNNNSSTHSGRSGSNLVSLPSPISSYIVLTPYAACCFSVDNNNINNNTLISHVLLDCNQAFLNFFKFPDRLTALKVPLYSLIINNNNYINAVSNSCNNVIIDDISHNEYKLQSRLRSLLSNRSESLCNSGHLDCIAFNYEYMKCYVSLSTVTHNNNILTLFAIFQTDFTGYNSATSTIINPSNMIPLTNQQIHMQYLFQRMNQQMNTNNPNNNSNIGHHIIPGSSVLPHQSYMNMNVNPNYSTGIPTNYPNKRAKLVSIANYNNPTTITIDNNNSFTNTTIEDTIHPNAATKYLIDEHQNINPNNINLISVNNPHIIPGNTTGSTTIHNNNNTINSNNNNNNASAVNVNVVGGSSSGNSFEPDNWLY
jgi:hypothetical protein